MTTVVAPSSGERGYADRNRLQIEEIRRRVQLVLWSLQPERRVPERRRERRVPYPYPIFLSPVTTGQVAPNGPAFVVLGRHLSELGLDFYHREAVPYRHVIASFRCGTHLWVSLLADLSWCRFRTHGWYENGGRFLQPVATPAGLSDMAACTSDFPVLGEPGAGME